MIYVVYGQSFVWKLFRKDDSRRKRRRSAGNGLRQFSEDVLRKVERKGTTTYNEVADELVSDMYRLTDRQFMVSLLPTFLHNFHIYPISLIQVSWLLFHMFDFK